VGIPYQVLRVWERPAAEFLNGPLGLIPLAPLAEVKASELPRVVSDMRSRIDAQSDRSLAAKLWTATYLLMGLRFDPALVKNVLSGVMQMEESTTYQEILQRGVARGLEQGSTAEAVKALLLQGRKKFKVPATPAHEATLNGIKDLPRLEALLERILDASTWDELLAGA
jgi:predicted transposase YdaD